MSEYYIYINIEDPPSLSNQSFHADSTEFWICIAYYQNHPYKTPGAGSDTRDL
jgi:hypothetical protein